MSPLVSAPCLPPHQSDLLRQAISLCGEQQWETALKHIDRLLAENEDFAPAWVERALILAHLERPHEGLHACREYLARQPGSPLVDELCTVLQEQALILYESQLLKEPENTAHQCRLAEFHQDNGAPRQAACIYIKLLAAQPDNSLLLDKLACCLTLAGMYREAQAIYQQLSRSTPESACHWFNLGNTLRHQGKIREAESAYQQAIALAPGLAEAWLELGHCKLMTGNFKRGWALYEWRWQTRQLQRHCLQSARPWWLGDFPLHGKTLLLWCEQGFGDSLQFIRYLPALEKTGARIILRAPSALCSLFAAMRRNIVIIDDRLALPEHDAHCPLMSLPLALGKKSPPRQPLIPYLHPAPEKIRNWADFLAPHRKPQIGLLWAGRQYGAINPGRDIPLEALLPLAALPIELVCLQTEIPKRDHEAFRKLPAMRCPAPMLTDFHETAALICNLDLVISVDSAVAHLAGALGKPCYLLLRNSSEWRWQNGRTDSPWYPSLRLFRQKTPGDWESVVQELMALLPSN